MGSDLLGRIPRGILPRERFGEVTREEFDQIKRDILAQDGYDHGKHVYSEDIKRIRAGIGEKYRKAAASPEGAFKYPTGGKGLEEQQYDPNLLDSLDVFRTARANGFEIDTR